MSTGKINLVALAISLFSISLHAEAQCIRQACNGNTNMVKLPAEPSGSYTGNTRFKGSGTLPANFTVTNWDWLCFDTKDSMSIEFPLELSGKGGKLYTSGKVNLSSLSLNGGDTLFVCSGICTIANIASHNSARGKWNAIILEEGAEVYIGGIRLVTEQNTITLFTGEGKETIVKVAACNKLGTVAAEPPVKPRTSRFNKT